MLEVANIEKVIAVVETAAEEVNKGVWRPGQVWRDSQEVHKAVYRGPHLHPDHQTPPQRHQDCREDHLPGIQQDHLRRHPQEAEAGQPRGRRVHRDNDMVWYIE